MSNKSISDFVASTMDTVIKSSEHKSLFGSTYKFASDQSSEDEQSADDLNDARKRAKPVLLDSVSEKKEGYYVICSQYPNFNFDEAFDSLREAKEYAKKILDKGDSDWIAIYHIVGVPKVSNDPSTGFSEDIVWEWRAPDDMFAPDYLPDESKDNSDSSYADDSSDDVSAAYDVAIDSLITASAALDSLGLEKSATVSLKLASFIVEAKKVDKDKEKAKAKAEKEKAKAKADKEKAKLKAEKEKAKAKADKEKAKAKSDSEKAKAKAKSDSEKSKSK